MTVSRLAAHLPRRCRVRGCRVVFRPGRYCQWHTARRRAWVDCVCLVAVLCAAWLAVRIALWTAAR